MTWGSPALSLALAEQHSGQHACSLLCMLAYLSTYPSIARTFTPHARAHARTAVRARTGAHKLPHGSRVAMKKATRPKTGFIVFANCATGFVSCDHRLLPRSLWALCVLFFLACGRQGHCVGGTGGGTFRRRPFWRRPSGLLASRQESSPSRLRRPSRRRRPARTRAPRARARRPAPTAGRGLY